MYNNLKEAFDGEVVRLKDISQYYAFMNSHSRASANIGFLDIANKRINIVTCDKHDLCHVVYRDVLNYSTSNYLGLGQHRTVIKEAESALKLYGTGSNGSPILSGYYVLHHNLEVALCSFHGYEDALLTSSGFMANLALLTSIFTKKDSIFLEAHAHGSIIMGAKLCGAKVRIYSENDIEGLEKIVSKDSARKKLIITCGVFSMSGKISNLPEISKISKISKKYKCILAVDDAHGLGVIGENGRGTAEHHGLSSEDIDIHIGTLSKSLSASGGYIAGKKELIKYLRLKAMPYVLSASLPPMVVAGALAALNILEEEGAELSKCLRERVTYFQSRLRKNNIPYMGESSIVVLPLGNVDLVLAVSEKLKEKGIYANAILSPGVRKGEELIRLNITLTHTYENLEKTAEVIKECIHKSLKASSAGVLSHV